MRSPGILRWEREDDFMDWRETSVSKQHPTPSSPLSTRRRRRKSRDELLSRAQESSSSCSTSQTHKLNVFCPIRPSSEDSGVSIADEELPKLPAMRLDQRQTRRQKDEATIQIEDLKKPSCLVSVINSRLQKESSCIDLSDEASQDELVNLIGTLLVTVERKIERVNLDDLIFPCPACRNIDTDDPLLGCKCAGAEEIINGHGSDTCNCGKTPDTCRSFEVAGIKHIDSDDEDEVRMGFGK